MNRPIFGRFAEPVTEFGRPRSSPTLRFTFGVSSATIENMTTERARVLRKLSVQRLERNSGTPRSLPRSARVALGSSEAGYGANDAD
jgi:hypothetical protein